MSAKDPGNGSHAQTAASQQFPDSAAPTGSGDGVQPCEKKHWIKIRVVDEDGKPLTGIKLKVELTDGTTSEILSDGKGRFDTKKTLPPGNCKISLPDTFDADWDEQ